MFMTPRFTFPCVVSFHNGRIVINVGTTDVLPFTSDQYIPVPLDIVPSNIKTYLVKVTPTLHVYVFSWENVHGDEWPEPLRIVDKGHEEWIMGNV